MKKLLLPLLLFCSIGFGYAQNLLGPKLMGMGNNGAAIADLWSVEGNSSGITEIQKATLGLSYAYRFFNSQLSQQALALVIPLQNNYVGIGIQRYGITAYNELRAGFAYAKKFGEALSIGLKVNYHQIRINNYGQTTGFSIDVGTMYRFSEQWVIGAYFNNPAQQEYKTSTVAIDIPSKIQLGISYLASNKVTIATSFSKEIHQAIAATVGIDYQLLSLLSFRAGISVKPFKQYIGLGLFIKKINIDVAIENDPYLGYSSQIALAYAF